MKSTDPKLATISRFIAHVDWITATLPKGSRARDVLQWEVARQRCLKGLEASDQVKAWSWQGYTGAAVPGFSWGTRDDGAILRATGQSATHLWPHLPLGATHVPRIDIAVTFWFEDDQEAFAVKECRNALKARDAEPASRKRRVVLYRGFGGGDTLYIGSRTSLAFGRLYDKGRESRLTQFENAWRAEVEYHNEAAAEVLGKLQREKQSDVAIAATVKEWFKKRGVYLPYRSDGPALDVNTTRRKSTDDERRLRWLQDQVAPVVKDMATRIDIEEIRAILLGGDE